MEKVVKCNKCGQYFMHTEKATKCPFCKTEYVEVEEKTSAQSGSPPDGRAGASGGKGKEEATRTKKNLSKFGKIIKAF